MAVVSASDFCQTAVLSKQTDDQRNKETKKPAFYGNDQIKVDLSF